jgi:hypothetical protein
MAYAGYDYAEEKASIGSSNKIGTEFDARVAMSYVLEWRRSRMVAKEEARSLYDGLRWGWSQHEFVEAVREAFGDCDHYSAGEVTASSVFTAQAILRRLLECLEQADFQRSSREWFQRGAA